MSVNRLHCTGEWRADIFLFFPFFLFFLLTPLNLGKLELVQFVGHGRCDAVGRGRVVWIKLDLETRKTLTFFVSKRRSLKFMGGQIFFPVEFSFRRSKNEDREIIREKKRRIIDLMMIKKKKRKFNRIHSYDDVHVIVTIKRWMDYRDAASLLQ